jgi:hypothetical protein
LEDIAFPAEGQITIPANWVVTISGVTMDTKLDGCGMTRHFYIQGALTLENLTLIGGWADPSGEGNWPATCGGAIFLADGGIGQFISTSFISNSASLGGAIDIEDGSKGTFKDSAFYSNYGATHGGAIFISNAGGNAIISGTLFDNNTAGYGGNDIFNMASDPSDVQCASTCEDATGKPDEGCTPTVDCYECTCYSCTCHPPTNTTTCSADLTCTACDACCVDYLLDQASCNACVEEQC